MQINICVAYWFRKVNKIQLYSTVDPLANLSYFVSKKQNTFYEQISIIINYSIYLIFM